MPSLSSLRPILAVLLVSIGLGLPAAGQRTGTTKRIPPKLGAKPAQPSGATEPAQPPGAKARAPTADEERVLSGLRGVVSPAAENEAGEEDPAFEPFAWLRRGKAPRSTASAASAASSMARLVDHPKRDELARWLSDGFRGREIDVALLGGHKYMINDCLGLKASAGTFRLKLENPQVYFENAGIVVKFEIDHVSISAIKIRIKPNPNPLELCKFSKKFEVGGAMDKVKLTMRCDPLYELERCRLSSLGNANPEVRIGNLNLKPLQNDLDRMAKNLIEDSLTLALQMEVDGVASMFGDLLISLTDQFLEVDCPTHPGDTTRAIGDLTRAAGGLGGGAGRGASSGTGGAPAPGATSGGYAPATYTDEDVAVLFARIEELEARIAELEALGAPPSDLEDVLQQALLRIGELGTGATPPALAPELEGLLARLLAASLERGLAGEASALEQVTELARGALRTPAQPPGAAPQHAPAAKPAPRAAWSLVPNPELKGRMGRVVVHFPDPKLASATLVVVQKNGAKVTDHYGESDWELLPEHYDVLVTNAAVPGCEVRSGNDTVVRVGMLSVELAGHTLFTVFPKGGQEKLYDHYGSATIGLPVGSYEVEIQGQRAAVEVREGEITRF